MTTKRTRGPRAIALSEGRLDGGARLDQRAHKHQRDRDGLPERGQTAGPDSPERVRKPERSRARVETSSRPPGAGQAVSHRQVMSQPHRVQASAQAPQPLATPYLLLSPLLPVVGGGGERGQGSARCARRAPPTPRGRGRGPRCALLRLGRAGGSESQSADRVAPRVLRRPKRVFGGELTEVSPTGQSVLSISIDDRRILADRRPPPRLAPRPRLTGQPCGRSRQKASSGATARSHPQPHPPPPPAASRRGRAPGSASTSAQARRERVRVRRLDRPSPNPRCSTCRPARHRPRGDHRAGRPTVIQQCAHPRSREAPVSRSAGCARGAALGLEPPERRDPRRAPGWSHRSAPQAALPGHSSRASAITASTQCMLHHGRAARRALNPPGRSKVPRRRSSTRGPAQITVGKSSHFPVPAAPRQ